MCAGKPGRLECTTARVGKEAITNTWDANSDVTFVDWTRCPATSYLGLRLLGTFDDPANKRFGSAETRQPGELGMGWASDVKLKMYWDPAYGDQCMQMDDSEKCLKWLHCFNYDDLETCVKTVAVHEFGHALAFAHEQDRPESPEWCKNLDAVKKEPKKGDG